MKKLSLLILTFIVAFSGLANSPGGAPKRFVDEQDILGLGYNVYQRTDRGSAVDPMTHTTCIPQDGPFELLFASTDLGTVYIKNIVYGSELEFGDYWVEGQMTNEFDNIRIIVELGQTIWERQDDGSFIRGRNRAVLAWGTVNYDAATGIATFTRDASVTRVTYVMDDKTIHIEGTSGPIAIEDDNPPYINISSSSQNSYSATGLAIVWEDETDEWAGYLEWGSEMNYVEHPNVIDEQPEGELKTYNRTSVCFNYSPGAKASYNIETKTSEGKIVFCNDGRTVYIKDPIQSLSYGTWVKGSLNHDGTAITVPLPQDLSQDAVISMGFVGDVNGIFYCYDYYGYNPIHYIINGNTITVSEPHFEQNGEIFHFYDCLYAYDPNINMVAAEANIIYTLDSETDKTSAPVIKGSLEDDGHAYRVEITPTEPSTIYVRTQFAGTYSEWFTYSDPMVFTDAGQYLVEAYAVADGKSSSDHVSHSFEVELYTALGETPVGKQIVGTRYYNLMGQEVQQPDGVVIVVTTYSDGTTSAAKVVK